MGFAQNSITIENFYWDAVTTKQTTSDGQEESFGKTTEEMKLEATYLDWYLDTVWEITHGNYPTLRQHMVDII